MLVQCRKYYAMLQKPPVKILGDLFTVRTIEKMIFNNWKNNKKHAHGKDNASSKIPSCNTPSGQKKQAPFCRNWGHWSFVLGAPPSRSRNTIESHLRTTVSIAAVSSWKTWLRGNTGWDVPSCCCCSSLQCCTLWSSSWTAGIRSPT